MRKNHPSKLDRPKAYRSRILLYALAVEWLFFGSWYLVSNDGMRSIVRLKNECQLINRRVAEVEEQITLLRREGQEWLNCPFYVEKYAREKLSMSYPGDEVLLVE